MRVCLVLNTAESTGFSKILYPFHVIKGIKNRLSLTHMALVKHVCLWCLSVCLSEVINSSRHSQGTATAPRVCTLVATPHGHASSHHSQSMAGFFFANSRNAYGALWLCNICYTLWFYSAGIYRRQC